MGKPGESISYRLQTVTPQLAKSWLDNSTFDNRRMEEGRVKAIASDIKNGRWVFDGTPIRFSGENVIDGQHRLYAIIRANTPVETLVVRGLSQETKNTIDTGKPRSAADVLHFNGQVNAGVLAAVARLSLNHKRYSGNLVSAVGYGKANLSTQEIVAEVASNSALIKATQSVVSLAYIKKQIGLSVPAFCYYLFMKASSQHLADHFFQGLEHGADLPPDSPILLLRNALTLRETNRGRSGRYRSVYYSALIIKAWNAWSAGTKIQRLTFGLGEGFPIPSK